MKLLVISVYSDFDMLVFVAAGIFDIDTITLEDIVTEVRNDKSISKLFNDDRCSSRYLSVTGYDNEELVFKCINDSVRRLGGIPVDSNDILKLNIGSE